MYGTVVVVTALTDLFDKCWPQHIFTAGCSVSQARSNDQDDLAEVIQLVTEGDGLQDLVRRLRAEHPVRRAHLQQHDGRLWDVMAEAAAFAWAMGSGPVTPRFCFREGYPDLAIPESAWLEVKVVHESDREANTVRQGLKQGDGIFGRAGSMSRELNPMVLKNLNDAVIDAENKFGRAGSTLENIVWIQLRAFDWPQHPPSGWSQVVEWAQAAPGAGRLILIDGWKWREPRYDSAEGP